MVKVICRQSLRSFLTFLIKTLLILPKTKNFNWLHHVTLKIWSLQNPHGARFLEKKPGYGKLVLITSTVQVELLMLNFNFDGIRINFLQVLTHYGFSRLLCLGSCYTELE